MSCRTLTPQAGEVLLQALRHFRGKRDASRRGSPRHIRRLVANDFRLQVLSRWRLSDLAGGKNLQQGRSRASTPCSVSSLDTTHRQSTFAIEDSSSSECISAQKRHMMLLGFRPFIAPVVCSPLGRGKSEQGKYDQTLCRRSAVQHDRRELAAIVHRQRISAGICQNHHRTRNGAVPRFRIRRTRTRG